MGIPACVDLSSNCSASNVLLLASIVEATPDPCSATAMPCSVSIPVIAGTPCTLPHPVDVTHGWGRELPWFFFQTLKSYMALHQQRDMRYLEGDHRIRVVNGYVGVLEDNLSGVARTVQLLGQDGQQQLTVTAFQLEGCGWSDDTSERLMHGSQPAAQLDVALEVDQTRSAPSRLGDTARSTDESQGWPDSSGPFDDSERLGLGRCYAYNSSVAFANQLLGEAPPTPVRAPIDFGDRDEKEPIIFVSSELMPRGSMYPLGQFAFYKTVLWQTGFSSGVQCWLPYKPRGKPAMSEADWYRNLAGRGGSGSSQARDILITLNKSVDDIAYELVDATIAKLRNQLALEEADMSKYLRQPRSSRRVPPPRPYRALTLIDHWRWLARCKRDGTWQFPSGISAQREIASAMQLEDLQEAALCECLGHLDHGPVVRFCSIPGTMQCMYSVLDPFRDYNGVDPGQPPLQLSLEPLTSDVAFCIPACEPAFEEPKACERKTKPPLPWQRTIYKPMRSAETVTSPLARTLARSSTPAQPESYDDVLARLHASVRPIRVQRLALPGRRH